MQISDGSHYIPCGSSILPIKSSLNWQSSPGSAVRGLKSYPVPSSAHLLTMLTHIFNLNTYHHPIYCGINSICTTAQIDTKECYLLLRRTFFVCQRCRCTPSVWSIHTPMFEISENFLWYEMA